MGSLDAWRCGGWIALVLVTAGCTAPLDELPADGSGDGTAAGSTATDPAPGTSGEPTPPDDADGTGVGTGAASSDDTTGPDDTGPPPQACTTASLFEPGNHPNITIDVDGVSRSYDLYVPPSYDPTTLAPLVVNFHGLFGWPSQQADFSQFNATADAHGLLVAYPAGLGNSFNGGVCCGTASSTNVDDVGFARALVADVSAKMCVDEKRVHATGMSNGGHMAHRLACEAADLFGSVSSIAGVLSLAGACAPSRPISIIQFHGTADTIVSYNGVPSVVPMMEAWATRNGCDGAADVSFDQGDTQCVTWPGCDAGVEVTLCTIDGGGHCWPGNGSCLFGSSTTELHASEVSAVMFEQQPLP